MNRYGNICYALDAFSGGTSATQVTSTASGEGKILHGKGAQYTESGSISLGGKGAQYREQGSFDLSGLKGNVTFNSVDADIVKAALAQGNSLASNFSSTLADVISRSQQSAAAVAQSQQTGLDKVLASIGTLAESEQTDGASGQNKTVLYIVLAVFGALAAVAYFWRKR